MGIIYTGDKFKHSRMQLEFTNIMGKRRINELEKECENLRNCLHYVLEENKRGCHILGEPELKSSMNKRDLEMKAEGIYELLRNKEFASQCNPKVYNFTLDFRDGLAKKAEDL